MKGPRCPAQYSPSIYTKIFSVFSFVIMTKLLVFKLLLIYQINVVNSFIVFNYLIMICFVIPHVIF